MMPKPMDGYVRVSRRLGREGPGYISPSVQQDAIRRWAEYKNVPIAEWHVDEDESGGTHDRPGLNAAISRAVQGETGGIVAWKIDRFSRFTEGGLRDLRQLEAVGARLAFVTEDIDTSGPMGKFVYTVMLAMSEYFLDNIKAGWRTAKSRAVERGAHIGPAPYGYLRTEDGTLEPDPDTGWVVEEAFRVAAADGVGAAVALLRLRAPERTWTGFTTRRFLSTRTYLGRTASGEFQQEGTHEPLVTRALFEAANHAADDVTKRRLPSAEFPLSGIGACGTCGGHLVGGRGGTDKRRVYRCSARCEAPVVVTADLLERHVVSVLREAMREHPGYRVGTDTPDTQAATTELEEAERQLDEFASDLTARDLLGHRYHQHLEQRVRAVTDAESRLRELLAQSQEQLVVVPDELWDTLEPSELGEVLRGGLTTVIVRKGRATIGARVSVVLKGMDRGMVPTSQNAQERGVES